MSYPITLVLCLDKHYANYAAVATYSAFVNSKSDLQIFWVVPEEDEASVIPITTHLAIKFGLKVNLVLVSPGALADWKVTDYMTLGTYLRLLIPTLINEPRAIYLDCDTLVLSDLGALFSMDIGDNVIAGAPDLPGGNPSRVPRASSDPYINAGVLLMNLVAMRDDQILKKAHEIYIEYKSEIVWHDQCILNKYAEGRKHVLHSRWNCQIPPAAVSEAKFKEVLSEENLAVLHFIGPTKPWQQWCNPYVEACWWRYADQVGIDGLKPQPIRTLGQADLRAQLLDFDGRFMEASQLKDKIILELVDILKTRNHGGDLEKHVVCNPAWQSSGVPLA